MAMPAIDRRWTAREVRALIDQSPLAAPRHELVDGVLLVTPSPNRDHQVATKFLQIALQAYLESSPVGEILASPFDVEVEVESILQPDLFVLPNDEFRRLADPAAMPARSLLLAIEVVSPSSARFDRGAKRRLYQQHVPEYWLVDLDAALIERWRPGEDRPEVAVNVLEWEPPGATNPFQLDIRKFFDRVGGGA